MRLFLIGRLCIFLMYLFLETCGIFFVLWVKLQESGWLEMQGDPIEISHSRWFPWSWKKKVDGVAGYIPSEIWPKQLFLKSYYGKRHKLFFFLTFFSKNSPFNCDFFHCSSKVSKARKLNKTNAPQMCGNKAYRINKINIPKEGGDKHVSVSPPLLLYYVFCATKEWPDHWIQ